MTTAEHPRHQIDGVLHQPIRFSIVASLIRTGTLGFREVRDVVEVSDSVLSKQVAALEQAGYVKVGKSFVGKTPRTSLTITGAGRAAWASHLAALRAIADQGEEH